MLCVRCSCVVVVCSLMLVFFVGLPIDAFCCRLLIVGYCLLVVRCCVLLFVVCCLMDGCILVFVV